MIENGILMKNSKVLIPETLKQKYLRQIHQEHQGIEACTSRASEFVFWVNINKDIEEMQSVSISTEFYFKHSEIHF